MSVAMTATTTFFLMSSVGAVSSEGGDWSRRPQKNMPPRWGLWETGLDHIFLPICRSYGAKTRFRQPMTLKSTVLPLTPPRRGISPSGRFLFPSWEGLGVGKRKKC